MNRISPKATIHPGVKLGANVQIDDFAIIGEPPKGLPSNSLKTSIGDGAVIRSHTVIYAGNKIGKKFQTGHGVLVRECNIIGDDVSVGSGTTLEHHINIEDHVRIHSNAFIPEFSRLRKGCWIGPGVVLTNAAYPLSPTAKSELRGPTIEAGAKIGGNASLLPGVIVGKNALVGAGTVVNKNIKKDQVVVGNPSREVNNIKQLSSYKPSLERIPLADLRAQYQELSTEVDQAIRRVLESGGYILGEEVRSFEKAFANFVGVGHCVGVSSGTSALHLTLEALGIKAGDEVITSPFTFIATAEAIRHVGARPVFVDIDPQTLCINPQLLEKAITRKTKAIVVVHIHGQPAEMDEILRIAKKRKLFVVEDAAQAHGARYRGRMVGSMGIAGCFSFFPAKNLGAYGDAGAVVTSDAKLAEKISLLRDHGRKEKYVHQFHGYNHRIDPLQAAVLSVKLAHLELWNQRRREIAAAYTKGLEGHVALPVAAPGTYPVYHQYVIRFKKRDKLQAYLKEKGIDSGVHYPLPLYRQPALAYLKYKPHQFPVSEMASREVLSLPMYPEITERQILRVTETIRRYLK